MSRAARLLLSLVATLLVGGGLAALLILNPTAREVTGDALGLVFAFFTTPFILETTCAALFLLGLLAYNRWRLHQEGDGWVWLLTHEPDEKSLPATITQRLQSTVLKDEPEPVDDARAEAGIIEGYLELGMSAEALRELNEDSRPHPRLDAVILRLRVLAANLDTETATHVLRDAAADPAARPALVAAALDNARWLLKHLQREDLARHWLHEARRVDPAADAAVAPGEPLRKLV
jgi:hypothetical protein